MHGHGELPVPGASFTCPRQRRGGVVRSRSTDGGTATPGVRSGAGSGAAARRSMGTTPAQVSLARSSSGSSGQPSEIRSDQESTVSRKHARRDELLLGRRAHFVGASRQEALGERVEGGDLLVARDGGEGAEEHRAAVVQRRLEGGSSHDDAVDRRDRDGHGDSCGEQPHPARSGRPVSQHLIADPADARRDDHRVRVGDEPDVREHGVVEQRVEQRSIRRHHLGHPHRSGLHHQPRLSARHSLAGCVRRCRVRLLDRREG